MQVMLITYDPQRVHKYSFAVLGHVHKSTCMHMLPQTYGYAELYDI